MKRILFISLAVVLGLSVALFGCAGPAGPEAPESIKVGLARELDEALSVFECGYGGATYRMFADKVNSAGGIYLSDYGASVEIELMVRDFSLEEWDIATVTEGLIEDGADFIWGGPGTDCIFTQAPVCNAHSTVYIGLEGGASSMIWGGQIDNWPFVWPTLSFSNWYQIPVLHDMMVAATGKENPKAYMTYIGGPGSTHGIEYRDETIAEFGAANCIDAGFHDYWLPAAPAAADAVIAAAAAALGSASNPNYDIFCAWTYPWNVAMLTVSLMASDFNPPAIIFGPGANAETYVSDFGPYVEGILSFVVAIPDTSPAVAEMYADIAAQVEKDWDDPDLLCDPGTYTSGMQVLDYWGHPCYVAGLEMWVEAVENAGNLDSNAVRDELAKFSPTNPSETCLGDTWFHVFGGGYGGGILDYECHPGEVGQWINMKYEIVGGNDPTASFVYPNTGNWFWLLD